jgi:hypothetical protein
MQQVGKWKAPPAPEANIFRIFISTDNHLGYAEKNDYPPRQDDSFRAVEEVLENATAAQARDAVSASPVLHARTAHAHTHSRARKLVSTEPRSSDARQASPGGALRPRPVGAVAQSAITRSSTCIEQTVGRTAVCRTCDRACTTRAALPRGRR